MAFQWIFLLGNCEYFLWGLQKLTYPFHGVERAFWTLLVCFSTNIPLLTGIRLSSALINTISKSLSFLFNGWFGLFFCCFFFFKKESLYIALAVLELTMLTWLALNSQTYTCLCLPRARIKGVHHHTWQASVFLEIVVPYVTVYWIIKHN